MALVKKLKRGISEKIHRDIVHTTIAEYNDSIDSKKIAIHLETKENLLELAYQDQSMFNFYQNLIDRDYMMYWHHEGASYFIKRKDVNSIWKRADLLKMNDLFYTLTEPFVERNSKNEMPNLVVIFSPLPTINRKLFSSNIADRTFQTYFSDIQKYLPKNTYLLRIMDINLTYGSLYFNTSNYPYMEDNVQQIVKTVRSTLKIDKNRTILFGTDSVGVSALYHALKGEYASVSTNPFLDFQEMDSISPEISQFFAPYLDNKRIQNDFKEYIPKISDKEIHLVIGTPSKFDKVACLENFATIYTMKDDYQEMEIAKNATIEQISFMNNFFLN